MEIRFEKFSTVDKTMKIYLGNIDIISELFDYKLSKLQVMLEIIFKQVFNLCFQHLRGILLGPKVKGQVPQIT